MSKKTILTQWNRMWRFLVAYQVYANMTGHGPSWSRMCENKIPPAAKAAKRWADASSETEWDASSAAHYAWHALTAYVDMHHSCVSDNPHAFARYQSDFYSNSEHAVKLIKKAQSLQKAKNY